MRRNGFKIREREDRGKEEDKERGGFGRRNGDKEGGEGWTRRSGRNSTDRMRETCNNCEHAF